jgi:glutamyl-tRNA synthetase
LTPQHTRIAPSPTGLLHIGTARTAYFNWLAARASGGTFLLRIDDTDADRSTQENTDAVFRALDWLGLHHDKTVKQSDRLDRYRDMLHTATAARMVVLDPTEGVYRLHPDWVNSEHVRSLVWVDEISGVHPLTKQDLDVIGTMVLCRSNGMPTYNFASVVDDVDFGINHIIRGTDHIGNTAKQLVLFDLVRTLECHPMPPFPRFTHIGLLFRNGKKLAKRDPEGFGSIESLMEKGYDPEAVLDFMLRMGWGPHGENKQHSVISKAWATELFLDHGKMKNTQANVDTVKLDSFDRKYKARRKQALADLTRMAQEDGFYDVK